MLYSRDFTRFMRFTENVVVAASYQIFEVVPFCDRERALNLLQ